MKKIYICIGVNGSGKTTYVQKQLNEETLVIKWLVKLLGFRRVDIRAY